MSDSKTECSVLQCAYRQTYGDVFSAPTCSFMPAMCAWHSVLPEQMGIDPVCGGLVLACGRAAGQWCQSENLPCHLGSTSRRRNMQTHSFVSFCRDDKYCFLYPAAHKTRLFHFQWLERVIFFYTIGRGALGCLCHFSARKWTTVLFRVGY